MVEKRIRVPGTEDERKLIVQYNNEMDSITKKIETYKTELLQKIDAEKKQSPKMKLYKEKEELESIFKEYMEQRKVLMGERISNNPMYKDIKDSLFSEKKKYNLGSYQEIEEQEKNINKKIITEKLTTLQEKKYSSMLLELKRKKKIFSQIKEKEEEFKKLDGRMKEINAELKAFNDKISEVKDKIMMIKADITKITEKKEKNEKIVEIKSIMEKLKAKKNEIWDKKKKVIEEKKVKEEKYFKYKDELNKQLKVEKEKKEIRNKMREFEEQKSKIVEEQNRDNIKKYDRIVESLLSIKKSKELMLGINLIVDMNEIGVEVPSSADEIENKVEEVKTKKIEFGEKVKSREDKYRSEIEKLDGMISSEKKKIESMPVTDIKLLKEEYGIKME